jgi:rare lipoprotein A
MGNSRKSKAVLDRKPCQNGGPAMHKSLLLSVVCAFATMGFVPKDDDRTIIASYYQSGEVTANGEKFNPLGMTAAHRRFKFGTILLVRNTDTGKEVVVRVNDRGPYIDGRSLDLSLGAAQKLGMIEAGLAQVKITVLN